MAQITRDNHFVPQWYLRQWAGASGLVWFYRLLVSDSRVPVWDRGSPRGLGFRTHLYTEVNADGESDDFERWIERDFEAPAQVALDRVLRGERLQPHHRQHLGRYAMCQQVRTPQHFAESMQRWEKEVPELMEATLKEAVRLAEESHAKGERMTGSGRPSHRAAQFDGAFRVVVRSGAHPDTGTGEIGVEALIGRDFWIRQQRHILEDLSWKPALHSWSIARPADGTAWITSDQPVVCGGFDGHGFNLNGGWGRTKGNIFMPLSPRHLLFTQIGEELPPELVLDKGQTRVVTEALAHRAHRVVFAKGRPHLVERLRPRTVDNGQYDSETRAWARWHDEQTTAQLEHDAG